MTQSYFTLCSLQAAALMRPGPVGLVVVLASVSTDALSAPQPTTVRCPRRGSHRRVVACRAQLDDSSTIVDGVDGMDLSSFDVEGENEEPESEPRYEPAPYPDGLHDAAKADREGPFWTTLGEPDVTTGVRPQYLRRDDWHISSTYTAEEREAFEREEQEFRMANGNVEVPAEGEVIDIEPLEDYDPMSELQYMDLDDEVASGAQPSKLPMPQSWQEYQSLQEQLRQYADPDSSASPQEREEAAGHAESLDAFYDTFKVVLAEGWTLNNNVAVEESASFLIRMKKAGRLGV
jgi:hypothetical protein